MRVGIVGAGITGLALLYRLAERGVDAVAFEADETPGGVVRTAREDGLTLDRGPQRLRLTPAVRALVESVGLGDTVIEADRSLPLFVYRDGALRRIPLTLSGLVTTDLLSWRGKVRVLAEPFTAPGQAEETAAELFSRKFGSEAYNRAIAPVFGGMYGSDPAEMPAEHALSEVLDLERRSGSLLRAALEARGDRAPAASFEGGMARLPEALAAACGSRVHLGTPVTAIRQVGNGFSVEVSRGSVGLDLIVVTAPAGVAADLLSDVAPEAAERLRQLAYNPLSVVHLRSALDTEGMGYQVAPDEALHTLGVTWNASLFGRTGDDVAGGDEARRTGYEGIYTCFLGGARDPDVLDRGDEELGELAAREFAEVTGAETDVLSVSRLGRVMPAYDHTWEALDGIDLPPGIYLAANYAGRVGIPGRIRQAEELSESLASSSTG